MNAEQQLEQSMQEQQIREAPNTHWQASAAGDANAEHDIYDDDVICDYPQSGERILGRSNLQALRSHHPGKPSGFNVRRILGSGDPLDHGIHHHVPGRPAHTVSIMEFRNGKVVHETQYFANPFEAPAWRASGFSVFRDVRREALEDFSLVRQPPDSRPRFKFQRRPALKARQNWIHGFSGGCLMAIASGSESTTDIVRLKHLITYGN